MEADQPETDWKLRLRYGKLQTPFHHYVAIAEGRVAELTSGFTCRSGKAVMSMKTWASSTNESANMIRVIGQQIGFTVTGRIRIYESEPTQPPGKFPHGYDVNFTPFGADDGKTTVP